MPKCDEKAPDTGSETSASLNGTYLNRELAENGELSDGDEVQIGKFKLVFVHGTGT